LDRTRLIRQTVLDAEPAAGVEEPNVNAGARTDLAHEGDHPLDRRREALEREDLAADVHVQPLEVEARKPDRPLDSAHRETLVHTEAELRVLGAGLDVTVRVGGDAGRDSNEDRLPDSACCRKR